MDTIKNPALGPSLQSKSGLSFFGELIPSLIGLILTAGVIIFLFVFLMGAIQWITSGGDKQAVESARSKLTNGLIGIVILFVAFAVIRLIERFFGLNILTLDIGPLIIR